jgi:hypothetical protein
VYYREGASSGGCKLKRTRGVCLRVVEKLRRRSTRGVCLHIGQKVKRRRMGGRPPHVHEKFRL